MVRINELLIRHGEEFYGYQRPTDFRLEERHPQLYPTNVRPETLAQDAAFGAEDNRLATGGANVESDEFHKLSGCQPTKLVLSPPHRDQRRVGQVVQVIVTDRFSQGHVACQYTPFGQSQRQQVFPAGSLGRVD